MSKITLGEWDYLKNGEEYIVHSDGNNIAWVESEADARLIAFAPEMYSTLASVVVELEILNPQCCGIVELKEYIDGLLARIDGDPDVPTQEPEP